MPVSSADSCSKNLSVPRHERFTFSNDHTLLEAQENSVYAYAKGASRLGPVKTSAVSLVHFHLTSSGLRGRLSPLGRLEFPIFLDPLEGTETRPNCTYIYDLLPPSIHEINWENAMVYYYAPGYYNSAP
jgi:hypothetical protein